MACKTCGHTMSCVAANGLNAVFWCPRCGHLKDGGIGGEGERPSLVGRVIEFASKLTDEHQDLIDEFERLGIRESITLE